MLWMTCFCCKACNRMDVLVHKGKVDVALLKLAQGMQHPSKMVHNSMIMG